MCYSTVEGECEWNPTRRAEGRGDERESRLERAGGAGGDEMEEKEERRRGDLEVRMIVQYSTTQYGTHPRTATPLKLQL